MADNKPKQQRRERLASDVAVYLKEVGRKAQKGRDPNDRGHDRELERKLRRMRPEELDALMRSGDDEHSSLSAP
jgi:hypothetical protein